ncbi:MAG: S8 family serine peptidase [Anaerolineae bacterium]
MMFRRFALFSLLVITLLWSTDGAVGSPLLALQPDQGLVLYKVSPWVLDATADGAQTDFLVVLAEQADLSAAHTLSTKQERGRFVRDTLWETAQRSQASLRAWLDAQDVSYRSFYIVNLLHVQTGDRALVDALSARPDVARIEANPRVQNALPQLAFPGPETWFFPKNQVSPASVEWNVSKINADDVWALGYTGQGIVVGAQDTGYDWDHPALINQYRGWNGSTADHDYNWHDAVHSGGGVCGADSTEPCDDHGHGTHTMGTVLGDDGGSNQIGVAPGARWIGCRNMNQGYGTPATYLECFEFFLAPYPVGGTPAQGDPDKAPDVTNNSWSCPASEGCSWNTLQAAIEAQRAAGIMTVVSAGNAGSGCSSVGTPPGIYDASYSVGATYSNDTIVGFSGRGPVTVDGSGRLKPDISAPGYGVRSSTRGGNYGSMSGTSMAAPHVAGAVALLWSAQPVLRNQIDLTENVLNQTALDRYSTQCGDPANTVPNNVYGWGRLDALAAVYRALAGHLEGTVSDDGGEPIVGAGVEAALSPAIAWYTTSISGGLYSLTLLSGTYTVTAMTPGYMPYLATGVMVTADSTATLNITLTPLYLVAGTVTQVDSGLPLSATVSLPLSATISLPGSSIIPTQTDPATGFYSLTVPSGSYTLRAEAPHHITQNRPITVTGNLTEDFYLEPLCALIAGGGFDYTPLEPQVRETVTFTATAAEGTAVLPVTYAWDFGDGVTNTVQVDTITHTFPIATTEQTYTVSLTIANTCPSQQKVKKAITVWPYPHTVYLPFVFKNY